jgi:hypothetical protein
MKKILGVFTLALMLISGRVLAQGTQISGSQIKDGAITTSKIADGAVTAPKFTLGIITNTHVAANAAIAYTKINFAGATPTLIGAENPLTFNTPLSRSVNAISISNIPYTLINFSGAGPGIVGAENPLTFGTPLVRTDDSIDFGGVGNDGWFYLEQYNNFTHNLYTNFTSNYEFDGYMNQAFPGTDFWHYNIYSYSEFSGTNSIASTGGIGGIAAELHVGATNAGPLNKAIGMNILALAQGGSVVTNIFGLRTTVGNNNTSATVDNLYGVYIRTPENANNAPIGSTYGLYIEDQLVSGTTASQTFQIFSTGKSPVRFKVTDNGVVPLQVQLNSAPTANAFEVLASNGTDKLAYITGAGGVVGTTLHATSNKLTNGSLTAADEALVGTVISKYTWANTNIVACGAVLTCDISLVTLPAKTIVKRVLLVVTGQAAGIGTLTGAVGITSATYTDYILDSNLEVSANTIYGDLLAELGTKLQDYLGDLPSYTATTAVKIHLIATDGGAATLVDVTGSTGVIYIETLQLP